MIYEYLSKILPQKWILFDINKQKTYIILKINQYNLYEKIISRSKLNEILSKNTSITIDKINLKSWYYKYASMYKYNKKYLPKFALENKVVIGDNIELPILKTCFIKWNECFDYTKSSDSDFSDITINDNSEGKLIEYLQKVDFGVNDRMWESKQIYFKPLITTQEDTSKIKDYDCVHSIRTNIVLTNEEIKALGKGEEIGNNIMIEINPENVKKYINLLVDKLKEDKFITIKIIRLNNTTGLYELSKSEPDSKIQSSNSH